MIRWTDRQIAFLEEYLHNDLHRLNATQCYMIAFPKASYKTATVNSCKLMKDKIFRETLDWRFNIEVLLKEKIEYRQQQQTIKVKYKHIVR